MNGNKPHYNDGALDERLRKLRPDPPPGDLRVRCLPTENTGFFVSKTSLQEKQKMRQRILFRGVSGLAVAAGLALALIWFWPGSPAVSNASAEVLRAALAKFDEIQAVHVVREIDDGPGTATRDRADFWIVRDAGYRTESAGRVEIYNVAEQKHYVHDMAQNTLAVTRYRDPAPLSALLQRCRAESRVEHLHELALHSAQRVLDEEIKHDKLTFRRLVSNDTQGRPLVVEIDSATQRVLRSEEWTLGVPEQPPVRQVFRFEYPEPAQFDPALFAPPHAPDAKIISGGVLTEARMQSMINLRHLGMMAVTYAQAHEGRLPKTLEELAPYAPNGDLAAVTAMKLPGNEGTVRVKYRIAELGIERMEQLDPAAALFEYELPEGTARCFGDTHVEFAPKPE